jgi:5-methylcytosine-specific restriction protein A
VTRRVILVCGAPCSGKTTYVRDHAQPADIVLDQDDIGATAMNRGLERITAMHTGTAWVIRCAPGQRDRDRLAHGIGATQVILLTAPEHVLKSRARARRNPGRHVRAVSHWLEVEQQGGTTQRGHDPVITPRTAW